MQKSKKCVIIDEDNEVHKRLHCLSIFVGSGGSGCGRDVRCLPHGIDFRVGMFRKSGGVIRLMKKAMIGVVPLVDAARESFWMLPGYMEGIEAAGGIPVMLPLTNDEEVLGQLSQVLNGFLFTGGQDVNPALYGEKAARECGESCGKRDAMEKLLLSIAVREQRPVLGICRGIQFINAALGGTLYQDLPTEHPSEVAHHQKPPYDVPVHTVKIAKQSPLFGLLGVDSIEVNSYHHQAVRELAAELQPMAYAGDGLIEAVWMPEHRFLWAVQWHPELNYKVSPESRKIFGKFVAECGRRF